MTALAVALALALSTPSRATDNARAATAAGNAAAATTQVVSIRAKANNKYVTANGGKSPLIANRTAVGTWEKFDLVRISSTDVYLRAHANGKYVSAESAGGAALISNRATAGAWEKFQLINNSDGTKSLRARVNNRLVTAENAGSAPLIANRTAIGPWEKFVIVKLSSGTPTTASTPAPTTTRSSTDAPATTSRASTPTNATSKAPNSGRCVGAANTPGGADPWGGCWPGPQNTGYPKGLAGDTRTPVTLTTYTGPTTIRSCGVVIDSKIVNETILVQAGNGTHSASTPCVTIKNSLVKGVIFAEQANQGPILITDTEVVPSDLPWWENIGRNNIFVYRVNSHGGQGVIKCDSYCEAKDNWVHGMTLGLQYHYNAFGGNGTNQFVIDHNWASCGDWDIVSSPGGDAGCSADIGFYGDFAPIQNITIRRNFLAGMRINSSVPGAQYRQPGYCLNPGYYPGKPYPAPSNVSVTENIFGRGSSGKCGVYGPTNSLNAAGKTNGNVWTNNRYDNGTPIARVEE